MTEYHRPDISIVPLQVIRGAKRFQILSFYRQWSIEKPTWEERRRSGDIQSQSDRFQQICQVWEEMLNTEIETITMSDTNLSLQVLMNEENKMTDYDKSLKNIAKHFVEEISPKGVKIMNDSPTHWSTSQQAESCIDHITTTYPARIKDVKTIKTIHSDHCIIHMVRTSKDIFVGPRYTFKRNYKSVDKLSMAWDLNINPDIRESKSIQDPNEIAEKLQYGIRNVLDKHAPKKVIQLKNDKTVKISQNTRKLQYQAKQLQNEAKVTHNPTTWKDYRRIRNLATASLKKDSKDTLSKQLDGKNPNDKWKAARQMAGTKVTGPPSQLVDQGQTITSPSKMAQTMNNFYINKIKKIREKFLEPTNDPCGGLRSMVEGKNLNGSLSIQVPTRWQLSNLISSMKPTKSAGYDDINMKLIKDYYSVLEEPIYHLVKRVIETQTFPQSLKVSRVIPLLKGTDLNTTDCASYRPVNILCSLGKVLDKVIFSQIQKHVDEHEILPPNHHGSRVGHTTTTAIIEMYESMIEAYENGQVCALVSLDQSLAYDLIDHQILVERLKVIGANDMTVKLMTSYFNDRKQYVEIETKSSSWLENEACSVIQGSLGSCLMYAIGTADLPAYLHKGHSHPSSQEEDCPNGRLTTFVDDSNNLIKADTINDLKNKAQETVDKVEEYLDDNKLKLNKDKTKTMVMCKPSDDKDDATITAMGKLIKPQNNIKVLGLFLSSNREWTRQINETVKSLQMRLITLRQLAKAGSQKTIASLAWSLVAGKIVYGIQAWGGTTLQNRQKLQKVINQAARIAIGPRSYRMSIKNMMEILGWSSIDQLMDIHTLNLAVATVSQKKPFSMNTRLSKFKTRETRYSNDQTRIPPSWRHEKSRWSFSSRAVTLLNNSPRQIFMTKDKVNIKKVIKQHIMSTTSYYVTPIGSARRLASHLMLPVRPITNTHRGFKAK